MYIKAGTRQTVFWVYLYNHEGVKKKKKTVCTQLQRVQAKQEINAQGCGVITTKQQGRQGGRQWEGGDTN